MQYIAWSYPVVNFTTSEAFNRLGGRKIKFCVASFFCFFFLLINLWCSRRDYIIFIDYENIKLTVRKFLFNFMSN